MSPLHLFRRLAFAEAVTWALLLFGMVLKYVTATTDLGVRIFGMAHGVVFVAYCLGVLFVAANQRWSVVQVLLGLLCAVPPFATIAFERWAERHALLDGGWYRPEPGAPAGSAPQRAVGWAVARPVATVVVGVLAVAVLTGVALLIGPPASTQG